MYIYSWVLNIDVFIFMGPNKHCNCDVFIFMGPNKHCNCDVFIFMGPNKHCNCDVFIFMVLINTCKHMARYSCRGT